ncbi:glutaminase [Bacteroides sp. 519]|uniref:glutaminase n=1 Tax=Bacteroides sp. 519 TaxID=2302937 RepID=UPI0013D4DF75|nr:glutaminase [Bacteroides sp. 519]NDV59821.1 glutaminase [Bacteroides sp. 519]
MNYTQILNEIYQEIKPYSNVGEPASYIPELQKVNPDSYGICLRTIRGAEYVMGDSDERFSIQSISKVFSLAMGFCLEGETLWKRIGVEPSGSAFNSVIQLEIEKGIPRNPLINAGALVVADILLSHLEHPEEEYLQFVRQLCGGNKQIKYNESMAVSEREHGYLNAAIANMLKYHSNIQNDIERVLRFYFRQCSLGMSCRELAQAFIPFSNHTQPFKFDKITLTASQVKRINAIMQTCGFYDEAGEFSYRVGLPGKSGVGGGIAAICPRKYSVAVWSPRLNKKGNSVMGMKALELLTTKTEVSIF